MNIDKSPDINVEKNRELLLKRSLKGIEKYGCTTENAKLDLSKWLEHLLEELLDACNYIQAAKNELSKKEEKDEF
jgi:hypothetical protein